MTYLYLDIETIPTQSADARRRIADKIAPPSNYRKEETIAAWAAEQKPAAVMEAVAKTSFDGAYGHVCCIGWALDGAEPQTQSIDTVDDEIDILCAFADAISKDVRGMSHAPTIVGHNVVNFDIRFLWQRAIVLRVKMPSWFPRDPKPWGGEVFDTMTAFAGQRGTISLDNLALALGLPGKDGVDGSMVAGMWERGEIDRIAQYCIADVSRVREIHKRMKVAGL